MRKLLVLIIMVTLAACSTGYQDKTADLPPSKSPQKPNLPQIQPPAPPAEQNATATVEPEPLVEEAVEVMEAPFAEAWSLSDADIPKNKKPSNAHPDRHDWKIDPGSGKTYQSNYALDKVQPGTYIEPGLGMPQGMERGIGSARGSMDYGMGKSEDFSFQTPSPPRQKGKTAKNIYDSMALGSGGYYMYEPSTPRQKGKTSTLAKRFRQGMVYWKVQSPRPQPVFNTEAYDHVSENQFFDVLENPLSTFSVDVDSASYANMRRFINGGQLPPKDSVRIEELVNYFPYRYEFPEENEHPFSVNVETAQAFWDPHHPLVRIGIKGKDIDWSQRPASNLVFLIDVSGSMHSMNKLPLVKRSLKLLIQNLGEQDRVAMVVYAGASGLALSSTPGDRKPEILAAIEELEAGGSTNGGAGIQLAYRVAKEHFIEGGINRVVLATDGDFNIGVTNQGDLVRLIEDHAKSNVFLTVLGYGMGNYKDSTLEKLADKGNGNYAYIDTLREAKKVLVEQIGGTMMTIAKDVKIQIEFNPLKVASYRLIGYENRMLSKEDFNDDKKDAGEIGSGHTVTALYEIVPAGLTKQGGDIDPLKYVNRPELSEQAFSDEWLTVKLRYKEPEGSKSRLITFPVTLEHRKFARASGDFKFAAAVASFGMLLRESEHKGHTSFGKVLKIVDHPQQRTDPYRREFAELVRKAYTMSDEPRITQLN